MTNWDVSWLGLVSTRPYLPSPLQILAWLSPRSQPAWNDSNRFLLRRQRRPVTLCARPRGQGSLVPTATALTVGFIHFHLFKLTKQRKEPLPGPQNCGAPRTGAASMSSSSQGHHRMRMTSKEAVAAWAGALSGCDIDTSCYRCREGCSEVGSDFLRLHRPRRASTEGRCIHALCPWG